MSFSTTSPHSVPFFLLFLKDIYTRNWHHRHNSNFVIKSLQKGLFSRKTPFLSSRKRDRDRAGRMIDVFSYNNWVTVSFRILLMRREKILYGHTYIYSQDFIHSTFLDVSQLKIQILSTPCCNIYNIFIIFYLVIRNALVDTYCDTHCSHFYTRCLTCHNLETS